MRALLNHGSFAILCLCCVFLGVAGCEQQPAEDRIKSKVESFDKIEEEILAIEKAANPDARKRIYDHFYNRRAELIIIAEGDCNMQDARHRALVRQMAWFVLSEIKKERPEVVKERPEVVIEIEPATPKTDIEKLPPEYREPDPRNESGVK